jgi:hypothetical protein
LGTNGLLSSLVLLHLQVTNNLHQINIADDVILTFFSAAAISFFYPDNVVAVDYRKIFEKEETVKKENE